MEAWRSAIDGSAESLYMRKHCLRSRVSARARPRPSGADPPSRPPQSEARGKFVLGASLEAQRQKSEMFFLKNLRRPHHKTALAISFSPGFSCGPFETPAAKYFTREPLVVRCPE
jgi:hypothetical protein